ncbi:MAG: response regulator transcription factor [Anaerolineae bacterium]|nr:response regulator transcription factor [Anaerolineae bacterium]
MTTKILAIDDDPLTLEIIQNGLESKGFQVITAQNGRLGLQKLKQANPDLIILDVTMPEMDGWETCRRIRAKSNIPIVMLTGSRDKAHIVKGLNLGADDYIVKPFNITELQARIEAVLRRISMPPPVPEQETLNFRDGEIVIDVESRKIKVRGEETHLTPMEYNLLLFLANRAGRIVATNTIFDQVWPYDTDAGPESVKWYIWRLRKKIETDPYDPKFIITEHGFGYRFMTNS